MANRVIREGINDSEKINALGDAAEIFYRRLFAIADDFGFFEADPVLLRSDLYKRKVDKITITDINKWIGRCQEVGLIDLYEWKGKPYGQIINFGQVLRIMRSKYPNKEGKFITKEEYLKGLDKQLNTSVDYSLTDDESTGGSTPDQWLKDLPNSTHLKDISDRTNIPVEKLIELIPAFKKAMELTYPTHNKFLFHFKNWAAKKSVETITSIKTSVSFGPKGKK